MLTVRITEAEDALLNAVKDAVGMERADVVREALDFWLRHGPQAERLRGLLGGQ
jgi:hypothetical protein